MERNILVNQEIQSMVDGLIQRYQKSTKNAVENILEMGLAVKEIYHQSKNGVLNDSDLQYFCKTVGLDPKSSMFRKYKCIGEKAHIFKQYLDKLPQSFSVIYEIATLDADLFDSLVVNGKVGANITLEELKRLASKKSYIPARNRISTLNPRFLSRATLSQALNKINKIEFHIYSSLTKSEFDEVIGVLEGLQSKQLIRFDVSDIVEYQIEPEMLPIAA